MEHLFYVGAIYILYRKIRRLEERSYKIEYVRRDFNMDHFDECKREEKIRLFNLKSNDQP